jgi:uncharacterized protein
VRKPQFARPLPKRTNSRRRSPSSPAAAPSAAARQRQREALLNVRGLIFFAFPLHPAGKPSDERAAHLSDVKLPMLFLQGENDALATLDLLRPVVKTLADRATLKLIPDADHSFHVPAKTGLKDADVLKVILDVAATWILEH